MIPLATFLCPPTLKFFLCVPTNGFLNLQKPVKPVLFIAVTSGNNTLEAFLLFPENQIFPPKQRFQGLQRICCGVCPASVPSPCLALPGVAALQPSKSGVTKHTQVSQNGWTAQVWRPGPLDPASQYSHCCPPLECE